MMFRGLAGRHYGSKERRRAIRSDRKGNVIFRQCGVAVTRDSREQFDLRGVRNSRLRTYITVKHNSKSLMLLFHSRRFDLKYRTEDVCEL